MNAKASEIGCEDTYFITPNGLDAEEEDGFHHTTASDLALLMRYCIMQSPQKDRFLEITGTQQYNFTDVGGTSSYSCYNRNAFLSMMSGALSGKTGFTGNAGYCYVGSLCRDGITYIVALLACGWPNNKTYKWSDTKLLMNYGLEAFSLCDLTQYEPERSRLLPILVNHAAGEVIGEEIFVPLKAELVTDLSAMLLSEGEELAVRYEIADTLEAPIEPDAYVGRVTYSLGDEIWKEYRILTAEGAVRIDFFHCLGMVLGLMLP
jgi:D-alanyl-D-alanine carboxypeptidase (penicillin-binding protein 5/6)